MKKILPDAFSKILNFLLLACCALFPSVVSAEPDAIADLRAKYASLASQLRTNQFRKPLVLKSTESSNRLRGEVYAVVDHPFDAVSAGLNSPNHWCDLMLLHINTKYCHAEAGPSGALLKINIGKKTPEELEDVPQLEFHYKPVAATSEYLDILLKAKSGPLGTSNYRIRLEAVSLANGKTFLHLSYAYDTSFTGRLAMQAYLGTAGGGKVGFTIIGRQADGQPDYIGGVRAMVERNTMRFYLAIDNYLASSGPGQLETRLQGWFTATEHYALQLHEMNKNEYLVMKRAEYIRQQAVQ
jgi:hypothetical protein